MKKIVSTISAGVMMFCRGARAPSASCGPRRWRRECSIDDQQQRHQRADRAGHDQRAKAARPCHQRRHDRGRDRAAEETGKGVDRKRAAHPRLVHMRRQDRIIGRMIDAVGEPEQRGAARSARGSSNADRVMISAQPPSVRPDQQDFCARRYGRRDIRSAPGSGRRPRRTRSAQSRARYSRRRAAL